MLLVADTNQRQALAADIAALIEEKDPLAGEGDVAVDRRLDALRRERRSGKSGPWGRMAKIARQYADMIHSKVDNAAVNPYEVGALLASAYPERIGKAWKEGVGVFQLPGGELVAAEASDAMAGAEWLSIASMH
jgi:ATP-dependent helicase HrpB